jgi:hypothetical protein
VLLAQPVDASGPEVRTAVECGEVDVYQAVVDAVQHTQSVVEPVLYEIWTLLNTDAVTGFYIKYGCCDKIK